MVKVIILWTMKCTYICICPESKLKYMTWLGVSRVALEKLFQIFLITITARYLFTISEGLPFGNGLKRRIYFNDRLACAKGISPKNDLDGGCSIFRNYCCNKTYLEVAKWDFEIRGKCIVLRSLKTTVCT